MTKADEGVAPTPRGAAHLGTPTSASSVGVAELTHEMVRDQLSEYLDDALGEAARRRIDGHLAGCPPCAAYLDTLRVTVRGARAASGRRRRRAVRRPGSSSRRGANKLSATRPHPARMAELPAVTLYGKPDCHLCDEAEERS